MINCCSKDMTVSFPEQAMRVWRASPASQNFLQPYEVATDDIIGMNSERVSID